MKSKIKEYTADDIKVTYDVARCIHAAECVRTLPEVFDPDKRPWVQPDKAAADEVAEAVLNCPTGALQFERHDEGASETPPEENTITVAADGPLYIHGQIEVRNSAGEVILQDTRVALCRCGASENKPFCDNRHQQIDFADAGQLNKNTLQTGDVGMTKLDISELKDGPLLLEGQVEIQSADGQATFEGRKGALCRCGASDNKPFCDGSHVTVDFEAT